MDRYVTSQSGDNRGTSAQSFKDDSKSLLFPESLETLQRGGGKRCRGGGWGSAIKCRLVDMACMAIVPMNS